MKDSLRFEIQMDAFRSCVRRAPIDEAEQIHTDLQAELTNMPKGSQEYERCADKIFFVQQNIRKKYLNRIQKEKKPWNLV